MKSIKSGRGLSVMDGIMSIAVGIFGTKYKAKAEVAGGIILILLGIKIILEHLGIF